MGISTNERPQVLSKQRDANNSKDKKFQNSTSLGSTWCKTFSVSLNPDVKQQLINSLSRTQEQYNGKISWLRSRQR